MSELLGKSVVLCVSGGIAAYKSADIISKLRKSGANVFVIMTQAATKFITPMTLEVMSGNRVVVDMFSRDFSWDVEHISLAKKADVFVIAPATANIIGKIANGIADDMISTTIMAVKSKVVIAPAMNTAMYQNEVVRKNISSLKKRGFRFVEPESGRLACGDNGKGKLADCDKIVHEIFCATKMQDLKGKTILVTAGPTIEKIDPVRFISNHSTGKMGYAIAKNAQMRGAKVILICGAVKLAPPYGVEVVNVLSASDMYDAVISRMNSVDWVIKSAAVGDYRPCKIFDDKMKKTGDNICIELVKNKDILAKIGEVKTKKQLVCGFSMETKDLIENSQKKLQNKNCDMLVANNLKVKGAGFAHDTNIVTILYKNGKSEPFELMQKEEIAEIILDRLLEMSKDNKD